MQLLYTVHSVVPEAVSVTAMLGDREVSATVPGLTVELVGVGHTAGHTYKFVPTGDADMAAHMVMFEIGNTIAVGFSLATPSA